VTLELPDQGLIMQIPNCNVAIAAAAEAHFRVRADGKGIACWGTGCHFGFNSGLGGCQIPDGYGAGFTTHNQGAAVGEKLD